MNNVEDKKLTPTTDGHGPTRHLPCREYHPTVIQTRTNMLQMLDHSGLLESCDSQFEIEQCRRDPVRAWEDWKELESRHRYVPATLPVINND